MNYALGLSVMLLTVFIIKFKDYNVINNSLLQEIKKQNLELKRSMETFQVLVFYPQSLIELVKLS